MEAKKQLNNPKKIMRKEEESSIVQTGPVENNSKMVDYIYVYGQKYTNKVKH